MKKKNNLRNRERCKQFYQEKKRKSPNWAEIGAENYLKNKNVYEMIVQENKTGVYLKKKEKN